MQEMQQMWVRSLGQEDPLEEGMATHSSTLAWRIPWTESLAGYSPGGGRIGHDWNDWANTHAQSLTPEDVCDFWAEFLCKQKCVHWNICHQIRADPWNTDSTVLLWTVSLAKALGPSGYFACCTFPEKKKYSLHSGIGAQGWEQPLTGWLLD